MSWLRSAAAVTVLVLCMVLPFLPGRYDGTAAPLSLMAHVFGFAGLLLVPFGIAWVVSERLRRVALAATSIVWIFIAVGVGIESFSLAIVSLLALLWWKSARPLELIVVPIAVALIQFAIADPIPRFSRNRAIRNAAPLIAEIERHRVVNGRYPLSLMSVWPDIWPSVIGIREYRYEPHGEAYNLVFENPTLRLGTREFVVYNPRGEQVMTSHRLDILQMTPEQLALDRTRGHNEVHDAGVKGWKYFWFD